MKSPSTWRRGFRRLRCWWTTAPSSAARAELWSEYRIPAEYGAAAALAALISGAYVPSEGERVAVIVCGANTDSSTLETPLRDPTDSQKAVPNVAGQRGG